MSSFHVAVFCVAELQSPFGAVGVFHVFDFVRHRMRGKQRECGEITVERSAVVSEPAMTDAALPIAERLPAVDLDSGRKSAAAIEFEIAEVVVGAVEDRKLKDDPRCRDRQRRKHCTASAKFRRRTPAKTKAHASSAPGQGACI